VLYGEMHTSLEQRSRCLENTLSLLTNDTACTEYGMSCGLNYHKARDSPRINYTSIKSSYTYHLHATVFAYISLEVMSTVIALCPRTSMHQPHIPPMHWLESLRLQTYSILGLYFPTLRWLFLFRGNQSMTLQKVSPISAYLCLIYRIGLCAAILLFEP
jgi:hypothetical protein